MWVEIKQLMDFPHIEYCRIKCRSDLQTYKHNLPENLALQISGISKQQTLSMLVSIGAQHSQHCYLFYHSHYLWLHYCCWQDHSQNSCHNQQEPLIMLVQSNFSKLVILSVSDSAPDTDRDLLDSIFPNEMIKKNELDHIAYRAVLK